MSARRQGLSKKDENLFVEFRKMRWSLKKIADHLQVDEHAVREFSRKFKTENDMDDGENLRGEDGE